MEEKALTERAKEAVVSTIEKLGKCGEGFQAAELGKAHAAILDAESRHCVASASNDLLAEIRNL